MADETLAKAAGGVRLLVRTNGQQATSQATVVICGEEWHIKEFGPDAEVPPFLCVSYNWEKERVAHPSLVDQTISARTIPVLETVIRAMSSHSVLDTALTWAFHNESTRAQRLSALQLASDALWIDALCVPQQQPARDLCLLNMSSIFEAASCVIAVLSSTCRIALQKIQKKESLILDDLVAVESDNWITRAWTYQEQALSQLFFCCAERAPEVLLSQLQFLGAMVVGTTDYVDAQGEKRIEIANIFPRIDKMEELLAESEIFEHVGRPVFQIISAMAHRNATVTADHFHAMVGLVSKTLINPSLQSGTTPADYFMELCAANNDFSFMFCTNERSTIMGRKWRPTSTASSLTPVVTRLLVSGNGMAGSIKESHIELQNMACFKTKKPNPVLSAVGAFTQIPLANEVLSILRAKDFQGHGQQIEVEHGYFFPFSPTPNPNGLIVAICLDVTFTQGAPGILLRPKGDDVYEFCDVGVFVGRFTGNGDTICVE
jgi:hypothetical protein